MGIFKGSQEILVAAPDNSIAHIWGIDRIDQRICHCTVYLYLILTDG
jgi:hypothetical protein